jgi:hypothetical protein
VTYFNDRGKIPSDKGLSTSKIDLKDLMGSKLIDYAETLIERKLSFSPPPRFGKTMNARKVAVVRYLPGHINRSVESLMNLPMFQQPIPFLSVLRGPLRNFSSERVGN